MLTKTWSDFLECQMMNFKTKYRISRILVWIFNIGIGELDVFVIFYDIKHWTKMNLLLTLVQMQLVRTVLVFNICYVGSMWKVHSCLPLCPCAHRTFRLRLSDTQWYMAKAAHCWRRLVQQPWMILAESNIANDWEDCEFYFLIMHLLHCSWEAG